MAVLKNISVVRMTEKEIKELKMLNESLSREVDSLFEDRKKLATIISYLENRIERLHIELAENETFDQTDSRKTYLGKEYFHADEL